MKSRNINLLALFESHWPGSGATNIHDTTILHSGMPFSHTHGVAILLRFQAKLAWEAAGSVFQLVSECILRIYLKCHLSYMSVLPIYAPNNSPNPTSESAGPSDPACDMLVIMVTSMLKWFLTAPLGTLSWIFTALENAIRMENDCWTVALVIICLYLTHDFNIIYSINLVT